MSARARRATKPQALRVAGWAALAGIGAAAFAAPAGGPAPRADSVGASALPAPPKVAALLRRACYDCHSNETRWPWYSRIAPLSWRIARDVERGRQELNFSAWGDYYAATRRRKLKWIGRAVENGTMPPFLYCVTHSGARLTREQRAAIVEWVERALARQRP